MGTKVELYNGDCLKRMLSLGQDRFDAIIADLPYGITASKVDNPIPFSPMWRQYGHVAKERAPFVLFALPPFSSALVMSNPKWYKYYWIWKKNLKSGNLNARRRPMLGHEEILVFYRKFGTYNPQRRRRTTERKSGNKKNSKTEVYGNQREDYVDRQSEWLMPDTILDFKCVHNSSGKVHPNQKPIDLMEYLVETYTNKGDWVLDNTMGSGATGVACVNTGRNFVGIEMDEHYFEIAKERIEKSLSERG